MNEDSPDKGSEQEAATRRWFLKVAIGVMAFLNGLLLGIPFINALISSPAKKKPQWSNAGEMNSLPEGQPIQVKFGARTEDAYHYENVLYSVWVIKHSADKVTVFSPICPHLGCHYLWNQEIERFTCPCHASVFSLDGKVLYGPAPRPLDSLPYKIADGALFVRYERFKVGVPEQISV
ncbi:MAG: ubiquinol-cytochrome c reductase iron-sulfur subunit [Thermodesulfovibrionales bacterium]